MADFQETGRQADAILASLKGLDTADRDDVRQDAETRIQAIRSSIGRWRTVSPADTPTVRKIRDEIADDRESLHHCAIQLELLRTEWADRYRKAIGEGKDAFEKLSEQLQQQQSAEAYRWKRNFSQMTDVMEAVNRFNGQLMDLSTQIEQENGETKPEPEIGPVDRTDRDPEMPANMS